MSEKIELQNKQMKATIKESVNSTLLDFQSHIIFSVKGMMVAFCSIYLRDCLLLFGRSVSCY